MPRAVDPRAWAAPARSGVRRFIPILSWLPAYDRRNLRFDLVAGATVWGLLVPEMIARWVPGGIYPLGTTLVGYTAADQSGNTNSCNNSNPIDIRAES